MWGLLSPLCPPPSVCTSCILCEPCSLAHDPSHSLVRARTPLSIPEHGSPGPEHIRYGNAPSTALGFSTVLQHSSTAQRYSTAQANPSQHNTAPPPVLDLTRHSSAQRNPSQHSTAQHRTMPSTGLDKYSTAQLLDLTHYSTHNANNTGNQEGGFFTALSILGVILG